MFWCAVVCLLYGIVTEYNRHKIKTPTLCMLWVFLWAFCDSKCTRLKMETSKHTLNWHGLGFTVNTHTHSHWSPAECNHKINTAQQDVYDSFTGMLGTFLSLTQLVRTVINKSGRGTAEETRMIGGRIVLGIIDYLCITLLLCCRHGCDFILKSTLNLSSVWHKPKQSQLNYTL